MRGIVDVGGGNRDAFGAGVFDYLMDNSIYFDYCIGVSAGSANCASYVSRQRGRNLEFYTKYNLSRKSINPVKHLFGADMINLDYIYSTLSNSDGASPLDYETMISSGTDMRVVATDADSGEAVYIKKSEIRKDDYGAFSASSALPPYNKAYHWHGRNYFDGGISDPIPHHLAFSEGCEKVVIILTLPKTHFRDTSKDAEGAEKMKKYPAMVPLMQHKSELYNRQLKEALELEEKGKVLIVAPDGYFKGGSLAKDKNQIMQIYEEGYEKARMISDFIYFFNPSGALER